MKAMSEDIGNALIEMAGRSVVGCDRFFEVVIGGGGLESWSGGRWERTSGSAALLLSVSFDERTVMRLGRASGSVMAGFR